MQSKKNSRSSSLWGWLQHNRSEIVPLTFLLLLWVSVLLTNPLGPNQWLIGWDNINPEFNLLLNIKRAIFSVWQEYQGMGLVAGMGHAADLPRLIILLISSLIIPANYLRFAWVAFMLTAGSLGTYFLAKHITASRLAAVVSAAFLLTNFATRQTFYTPFEPFVTHFGFLPWLILAILRMLEHPTKKRILWFAVLSFLATPQAYVQTVFISYLLVVMALSIGRPLKRVAIIWFTIFCMNAFWLLPTIYFWTTGSQVTVNAKINQMATEEAYLKNLAAGTLDNTVQLKGFWFDTADFDPQKSTQTPLLGFWRTFSETPLVRATVYGLFGVILVGIGTILWKRTASLFWLVGIFLLAVTLLTINTPPFSWVNELLDNIPLFHQAFRIRFTKINTMAGLSYSLLFGVGFATLIRSFKPLSLIVLAAFTLLVYPVWQGKFFYENVKLSMPKEYMDLFAYFAKQPDGRVMNLPQHMYWGWTYYQWGYIGWGFPWYGIKQPIADRAFDVWSKYNENYYWELSRALYAKDAQAVAAVMRKYDIRYVLLDEYVTSPNNNRSLFIDEIKNLLGKPTATFGKLSIYEHAARPAITLAQNLPMVNPYSWTDNDVAYAEFGDYISGENGIIYPYRSLFTKRSVSEREFTLPPAGEPVYDSTKSADLTSTNVKECGLLKQGSATAKNTVNGLRFESVNQRGCLSFDIPTLSHKYGYLAVVESDHISGRPLMISFINDTARHVELETFLDKNDSFILPPLAPDGLGYTVYISNDAMGNDKTINELRSIRIYQIPYDELVHMRTGNIQPQGPALNVQVSHPNPAFYKITTNPSLVTRNATLILSQSFDPGWIAWQNGKLLAKHVLVNNWANGWKINPGTNGTIYIFFWPQLLEFLGFALLPILFLFTFKQRK